MQKILQKGITMKTYLAMSHCTLFYKNVLYKNFETEICR